MHQCPISTKTQILDRMCQWASGVVLAGEILAAEAAEELVEAGVVLTKMLKGKTGSVHRAQMSIGLGDPIVINAILQSPLLHW